MWFKTFICCGGAYVDPLPSLPLLTKVWKFPRVLSPPKGKPLHAVDMLMYEWSLQHYWPSHLTSLWIWLHFWLSTLGQITGQCFSCRLYTHSSGPPHQYQTHKRSFETFICCGCASVWVLTTLPQLLSTNLFEVSSDSCYYTSRGANHNIVH